MTEFEYARDRIIMGIERNTLAQTDKALSDIAFHEAGHAAAIYYIMGRDCIYKSTILPHGNILGGVTLDHIIRHIVSLKRKNNFRRIRKKCL